MILVRIIVVDAMQISISVVEKSIVDNDHDSVLLYLVFSTKIMLFQ